VLYGGKEKRNGQHTVKRRKVNWIGPLAYQLPSETRLLQERLKGREDEEGDVNSYCMTVRKGEDVGN
jgi:hypothetical protein